MEVYPASVALIIKAMIISARWAGRTRSVGLAEMTAAAETSRLAALEARVVSLEDAVQLRDAHIAVLESRLGKERPRKPYPLMERLRIIWLMEYFQIAQRRLRDLLGVSRSSVRRWLKGFQEGKLGKRNEPRAPVNKTPREIADLIWQIFRQNPLWGRHRIAMTLWGLGVFVAASTVRDMLRRPRPKGSAPQAARAHAAESKPRQIVARYPNHVWSLDRTRVWRWRIWPTWVLVAIDHYSRMATAACALEGPNARWVINALASAFRRHRTPRHLITDQEGVFVSDAFRRLLSRWNVTQRFGAVGEHGSIAVTEQAILTLKQEWLRRVVVARGIDHLSQLPDDFSECYSGWRGHRTLGGAAPSLIHRGDVWQRPCHSAKQVSGVVECRFFPDTRTTAYRLAA